MRRRGKARALAPTDRQLSVISALISGATREEVATALRISRQTVASHMRRARLRTESPNTAALVDKVLEG